MTIVSWIAFIAKSWALVDSERDRWTVLGVDPDEWPEGDLKASLVDFIKSPNERTRFKVVEESNKANPGPPPTDPNEFRAKYREELDAFNFQILASTLSVDPKKGNEVLEQFISKASKKNEGRLKTAIEVLDESYMEISKDISAGGAMVIIPGFEILSKWIAGFNGGRLTVITSKSGGGKTTLGQNLALAATKTMPVLFFNTEMMIKDIGAKLFAVGTESNVRDYYMQNFNLDAYTNLRDTIEKRKPFLISDGESLSINEICAHISTTAEKHGPLITFVDYDQKIITKDGHDEWRSLLLVAEELERAAKKTKSHVILFSQGNDDGLPKASKRMMQPATNVLSLEESEGCHLLKGIKVRFGDATRSVNLEFIKEKSLMREIAGLPPIKKSTFSSLSSWSPN